MKVHELIDRLSKLNPDGMIVALDEWGYYGEIYSVSPLESHPNVYAVDATSIGFSFPDDGID